MELVIKVVQKHDFKNYSLSNIFRFYLIRYGDFLKILSKSLESVTASLITAFG